MFVHSAPFVQGWNAHLFISITNQKEIGKNVHHYVCVLFHIDFWESSCDKYIIIWISIKTLHRYSHTEKDTPPHVGTIKSRLMKNLQIIQQGLAIYLFISRLSHFFLSFLIVRELCMQKRGVVGLPTCWFFTLLSCPKTGTGTSKSCVSNVLTSPSVDTWFSITWRNSCK